MTPYSGETSEQVVQEHQDSPDSEPSETPAAEEEEQAPKYLDEIVSGLTDQDEHEPKADQKAEQDA